MNANELVVRDPRGYSTDRKAAARPAAPAATVVLASLLELGRRGMAQMARRDVYINITAHVFVTLSPSRLHGSRHRERVQVVEHATNAVSDVTAKVIWLG
jgi:hypothetical protein